LEITTTKRLLTAPEKLEKILSLIEYIDITESKVLIGLNKDVIIYNNGSTISINKGVNVTFSDQIHFNPEIDPKTVLQDDFVECLKKSAIEQGCLLEPEK
jgi:hypothetical protein